MSCSSLAHIKCQLDTKAVLFEKSFLKLPPLQTLHLGANGLRILHNSDNHNLSAKYATVSADNYNYKLWRVSKSVI